MIFPKNVKIDFVINKFYIKLFNIKSQNYNQKICKGGTYISISSITLPPLRFSYCDSLHPEYIDNGASNELGFSNGSCGLVFYSQRGMKGGICQVARGLSRKWSIAKVEISGLPVELHG